MDSEQWLKDVGEIERLELKPGDRFVLTFPRPLSRAEHAHIQSLWREFVGGDADAFKLLILEHGMQLGRLVTTDAL